MIEGIPVDLIGNLTGWGLLGVLLAFGWLVPKRTVEREQKLLERQVEAWKEVGTQRSAQLDEILSAIKRIGAERERA